MVVAKLGNYPYPLAHVPLIPRHRRHQLPQRPHEGPARHALRHRQRLGERPRAPLLLRGLRELPPHQSRPDPRRGALRRRSSDRDDVRERELTMKTATKSYVLAVKRYETKER